MLETKNPENYQNKALRDYEPSSIPSAIISGAIQKISQFSSTMCKQMVKAQEPKRKFDPNNKNNCASDKRYEGGNEGDVINILPHNFTLIRKAEGNLLTPE